MCAIICRVFAVRFACESIAPLGVPVVPPVYCRTATSSCGETCTGTGRLASRDHLHVRHMQRVGHKARPLLPFEQREQRRLGRRKDGRHRTNDDLAQSGLRRHRVDLAADHRQIGHHHDRGAEIGDLLLQLPLHVERIEVHHRCRPPRAARRYEDHRIGRVRQAEADLDALADAEILQSPGGAADQIAKLAESPAAAEEVDRGTAANRATESSNIAGSDRNSIGAPDCSNPAMVPPSPGPFGPSVRARLELHRRPQAERVGAAVVASDEHARRGRRRVVDAGAGEESMEIGGLQIDVGQQGVGAPTPSS